MRVMRWIPAVLLFFIPFLSAEAEIYTWVDKSGNKHVTDDLSKVPQAYRDQDYGNRVEEETTPDKKEPIQNSSSYKTKKNRACPTPEDEPIDKYGRGEEYWRERAEAVRDYIIEQEDLSDYVSSLERDCFQKSNQHAAQGRRVDCSAYQREKVRIEANIARAKKMLDVDLPEEMRKAEAYPGWIR